MHALNCDNNKTIMQKIIIDLKETIEKYHLLLSFIREDDLSA